MTTDGLALAATILVAQLVPDRKVALEKACLDYLMRDNPLKIIQLCDEVYKQPPGVASTIRTTTPTTSEIPTRQRPSEEDTNTAPPAKKARPTGQAGLQPIAAPPTPTASHISSRHSGVEKEYTPADVETGDDDLDSYESDYEVLEVPPDEDASEYGSDVAENSRRQLGKSKKRALKHKSQDRFQLYGEFTQGSQARADRLKMYDVMNDDLGENRHASKKAFVQWVANQEKVSSISSDAVLMPFENPRTVVDFFSIRGYGTSLKYPALAKWYDPSPNIIPPARHQQEAEASSSSARTFGIPSRRASSTASVTSTSQIASVVVVTFPQSLSSSWTELSRIHARCRSADEREEHVDDIKDECDKILDAIGQACALPSRYGSSDRLSPHQVPLETMINGLHTHLDLGLNFFFATPASLAGSLNLKIMPAVQKTLNQLARQLKIYAYNDIDHQRAGFMEKMEALKGSAPPNWARWVDSMSESLNGVGSQQERPMRLTEFGGGAVSREEE